MASSSTSDILTAAKNIAAALSTGGTAPLYIAGSKSKINITADTLVQAGQGRIVRIIIVVAGSAPGSIHDAKSVATANGNNRLLPIPTTIGNVEVSFPVNDGIVIKPGTGQTVAVSYS